MWEEGEEGEGEARRGAGGGRVEKSGKKGGGKENFARAQREPL